MKISVSYGYLLLVMFYHTF